MTTSSAFPTLESVNEALSLAKHAGLKEGRGGVGEGVIVGIGSGPAIDLAKAVSDRIHGADINGNLILAPATLGGLWAASSSFSIVLDTKEEMLLPDMVPSGGSFLRRDVVVTLDSLQNLSIPPLYSVLTPTRKTDVQTPLSMAHAAAGALTILLDVARLVDSMNAEVDAKFAKQLTVVASLCASVMNAAATESKTDDTTAHLISAILHLPSLIEKTNDGQSFSETVPQQLANALLPTYFPQSHILTYFACILPGLCGALESNNMTKSLVREVTKSVLDGSESDSTLSSWASNITREAGIPTMSSLAFGTPDLDTLSQKVNAYDTLRELREADCGIRGRMSHDDSFLLEVLERSLNQ